MSDGGGVAQKASRSAAPAQATKQKKQRIEAAALNLGSPQESAVAEAEYEEYEEYERIPKPRGRPFKGKEWDDRRGCWVAETGTVDHRTTVVVKGNTTHNDGYDEAEEMEDAVELVVEEEEEEEEAAGDDGEDDDNDDAGGQPDPCERDPKCTRGYKHGGNGGCCSFPRLLQFSPAVAEAPPRRHDASSTSTQTCEICAGGSSSMTSKTCNRALPPPCP